MSIDKTSWLLLAICVVCLFVGVTGLAKYATPSPPQHYSVCRTQERQSVCVQFPGTPEGW